MKRAPRTAILICFLGSTTPVSFSQGPERLGKVAEGQYLQWRDGEPVKDTAQIWTIWRTKDGYEVEDKLPADVGDSLMGMMGAAFGTNLSPELREDLKNSTMKTVINFQMSKQKEIQALKLNGRTFTDSKQIELANCNVKEANLVCRGRELSAHLKNTGQSQLLYRYPFPLLFTQVLNQSRPATGQTISLTLVLLEEAKNRLQLAKVSGQLRSEGSEKMVIGPHTFNTDKFVLTFDTKDGRRTIALWTSEPGIVFAMEDSQFASGLRVVLSQYKKYSEF
jgi:hypothetical protein